MYEGKRIAKWGFGMAPVSSRMRERYDDAIQTGLDSVVGNLTLDEVNLEHISELKGMFNRCLRKDQWDWFSVFTELGAPDERHTRLIVSLLVSLRTGVKEKDGEQFERLKERLIRSSLLTYLYTYQDSFSRYSSDADCGWIYILSTREQPHTLKIGMTRRCVDQRVKEINSATGVLVPFAARKVFRVNDAAVAERAIFERLAPYRLRLDREFFQMPFNEAVATIASYLDMARLYQRKRGEVIWFDTEKRYGFLSSESMSDVFLHSSQVNGTDAGDIVPGAAVEFEVGYSPQGLFALNAKIVGDNIGP